MKTQVTFKIITEENSGAADVIALFPNESWDRSGSIASYMHVGQHGGASPDLIEELTSATPDQYKPLQTELENLGYSLEIV